ncbi:MAG: ribonucleotide reductase subunit alpha [Comamonadaceae bacterium]|nr:ribonucleotide reductase subunit alpha [Comamonadaceae bacterium]
MNITTLDDLLQAARTQPTPQRLLFVFAAAELPDDATAEERERFERGEGGALVPQMCVDKALDELQSFAQLKQEAEGMGPAWQMVFAAALSGTSSEPPGTKETGEALTAMVEAIRQGYLHNCIPFDAQGFAVELQ